MVANMAAILDLTQTLKFPPPQNKLQKLWKKVHTREYELWGDIAAFCRHFIPVLPKSWKNKQFLTKKLEWPHSGYDFNSPNRGNGC